ncbi:SIR2 family protein [Streptomyces sp. NPDC008240]|uniref:P-loop NTPase n=1 Tax=Streptomyces sp. NPDC008240 TaxID=3364822 RepID=UPI0036E0A112
MDSSGVKNIDEDLLVSRLTSHLTEGTRKVSFVTGSGISFGAIPNVDGIVEKMLAVLRRQEDQLLLRQAIRRQAGGEKYQSAAAALLKIRGQDALNKAIQLAVLEACTGLGNQQRATLAERGDSKALKKVEYDTGLWKLTSAVEHLGLLLRAVPAERRGPVITTNFDPLLEIAVRKAGAVANMQYLDFDGRIRHGEDENAVNIVHVHGYWREGDTLNTVGQLTTDRPELSDSLRSALRDHVVVVVGYSGWNDAFSRSLLERVRAKDHNGIDLIWCSFTDLAAAIRDAPLLSELQKTPRWTFFEEIDANRLFPRIHANYTEAVECPPGWTRVDQAMLDDTAAKEHSTADVELFFDGREPGWQEALDPRVPRLSVVTKLTGELHRCLNGDVRKRIVAAVGPMGEGKSIALLQTAVDLVRGREDVTVFWRERRSPIDVEAVLSVPERPGHRIVLVTDQGARFIEELRQLMLACESRGRDDILVLLAGQERDWRSRRGYQRLADHVRVVGNFGLQDADGELLVAAWEQLGVLGELAGTPRDRRASRLVSLSRALYGRQDSSLVGTMLQLRYGPLLRDHVCKLLDRMEEHPAVEGTSLAQCFLMIALLHVAYDRKRENSYPLTLRVLGRVVGLDEDYLVQDAVTDPLGIEAAVTQPDYGLWIRHQTIAEAALSISRERDPDELVGLSRRLVTAAIDLSRESDAFADDLHAAAYLARGLFRRDNKHLGLGTEAVAAARTAVEAAPRRLSFRTALMSTLRVTGNRDEALSVAEGTCGELESMSDPDSVITFVQEWGTSAGQTGKYGMNVLLDGVALHISRSMRAVVSGLLNMGVALTELHRGSHEPVFLDALCGVVGLVADKATPNIFSNQYDANTFLENHRDYIAGEGRQALTGSAAWEAVQASVNRLLPEAPGCLAPLLTKGSLSVLPPSEFR